MKILRIGDTVCLRTDAQKQLHLTLDQRVVDYTPITGVCTLTGERFFTFAHRLSGCYAWQPELLKLVKRGKPTPKITKVIIDPLKVVKKTYFQPSNFSDPQNRALKRFEAAVESIKSTTKHDKSARKAAKLELGIAYNLVCEFGVESALIPSEIALVNEPR